MRVGNTAGREVPPKMEPKKVEGLMVLPHPNPAGLEPAPTMGQRAYAGRVTIEGETYWADPIILGRDFERSTGLSLKDHLEERVLESCLNQWRRNSIPSRWFEFSVRGEGLAYENRDGNLWDIVKTRKPWRCASCADEHEAGFAYRPLTETGETLRYERVCVPCVER